MDSRIRIYEIKSGNIRYLGKYQKHIFAQTDGKDRRKYVGVVQGIQLTPMKEEIITVSRKTLALEAI